MNKSFGKVCKSDKELKNTTGITLIALIITIIVLLILAGITISQLTKSGLLNKTLTAENETKKSQATETMNLKITNIQISSYSENEKLPDLQYLADKLCEDNDMEYVLTASKTSSSLDKIDTTNLSSIYTKLKKYPYEFEINSSLQLASIDGVEIGTKIPDGYIKPSGTKEITQNGSYDISTYEKVNVNVLGTDSSIYTIPKITSSNPNVFSSGVYSKCYDYLAFDKNINNGQVSAGYNDSPWAVTAAGNVYIGYSYGLPVKVTKAEYTPRFDTAVLNQNLKKYKYQYSDDFVNWSDASNEITLDRNDFTEPIETVLNDVGSHYFWRLYVISNYGSKHTAVNELQFYSVINE